MENINFTETLFSHRTEHYFSEYLSSAKKEPIRNKNDKIRRKNDKES